MTISITRVIRLQAPCNIRFHVSYGSKFQVDFDFVKRTINFENAFIQTLSYAYMLVFPARAENLLRFGLVSHLWLVLILFVQQYAMNSG